MPLRLKLAKYAMPDSQYYIKFNYDYRRRYLRLAKHIEEYEPKLVCQECRGMGEFNSYDYDEPNEQCGWCKGLGYVTPWVRGLWLRWKKDEKTCKRLGMSIEELFKMRENKRKKTVRVNKR